MEGTTESISYLGAALFLLKPLRAVLPALGRAGTLHLTLGMPEQSQISGMFVAARKRRIGVAIPSLIPEVLLSCALTCLYCFTQGLGKYRISFFPPVQDLSLEEKFSMQFPHCNKSWTKSSFEHTYSSFLLSLTQNVQEKCSNLK